MQKVNNAESQPDIKGKQILFFTRSYSRKQEIRHPEGEEREGSQSSRS